LKSEEKTMSIQKPHMLITVALMLAGDLALSSASFAEDWSEIKLPGDCASFELSAGVT
jgi:hypothetical protein